ncbi:50S ribosomal protein L13 [candidate division SR1 bacterium Aalborg_AAW-1]|nr:50S ribosomal protein L13 [candidate division SR1 bacterium Aalborg_AAW-1]
MNQFTKSDLNQTLYVKKDIVDKSRKRYQIDATGLTLGRLAVVVTNHLVGKGKVTNCDFWDSGDFVVVHNVDKMVYTGNKGINKEYHTYSGYKGHVKSIRLQDLMKKDPSKVLRYAIKGMLPKNKLRAKRLMRLKSFVGTSTKFDYMNPTSIASDYLTK